MNFIPTGVLTSCTLLSHLPSNVTCCQETALAYQDLRLHLFSVPIGTGHVQVA